MDYLSVGLLFLAGLWFASGLLAYKVGRWVERKEAENTLLRAQVEELKAMLDDSGYRALKALRAYQNQQAEAANAKAIWKLGK